MTAKLSGWHWSDMLRFRVKVIRGLPAVWLDSQRVWTTLPDIDSQPDQQGLIRHIGRRDRINATTFQPLHGSIDDPLVEVRKG